MFGDTLAEDEAVALTRELASCRLPFQCAHGRPSVAPLLSNVPQPKHTLKPRPSLRGIKLT